MNRFVKLHPVLQEPECIDSPSSEDPSELEQLNVKKVRGAEY